MSFENASVAICRQIVRSLLLSQAHGKRKYAQTAGNDFAGMAEPLSGVEIVGHFIPSDLATLTADGNIELNLTMPCWVYPFLLSVLTRGGDPDPGSAQSKVTKFSGVPA